ncbi:carbohydrate sulfotransferase 1-like [Glandiceps talaboti]
MGDWLFHRYHLLRYEDLAHNPISTAQRVYEFLGLDLPETVASWLRENTDHRAGNMYSTTRDSDETAQAWKSSLSYDVIKEAESTNGCKEFMQWAGYRQVKNDKELLNKYDSFLLPFKIPKDNHFRSTKTEMGKVLGGDFEQLFRRRIADIV